ncbi:hypothetical protein L107_14942 [Cyanobium sp. Copco_Reservoir_LC18]|uniref:hypothetical protein n=1 Tax=Cyanobium sp. Copco_Reservoir_LC18 TaxID=1328305 RepID=UPI001358157D|nr:hypothetical protein [Cyanobium sp. Copco_Reservoir_LC18]KAF0652196.1 hypothetical protein L107_14942 [Cyanobium sp. Copco_Reservoir_LC18]
MTIELPQPRRQNRPSRETGPSATGWSPADELAALETVWASLCQDAASPAPSLQLPVISRSSLSRDPDRRPLRQLQRRGNDADRSNADRKGADRIAS